MPMLNAKQATGARTPAKQEVPISPALLSPPDLFQPRPAGCYLFPKVLLVKVCWAICNYVSKLEALFTTMEVSDTALNEFSSVCIVFDLSSC